MSEPVIPDNDPVVDYSLGLMRGEARRQFAVRLASDATLRARVDGLTRMLAEFDRDDAGADGEPPAGLFDKVLGKIDADGLYLPGTRTSRTETARWKEISPGVSSRVLHVDRVNNRQSLLIRMAAGATYHPHAHDIDEESFIVEGDLWFGDLRLGAGDYHIASAASHHPPGRTVNGCIVHVITSLAA